MLAINWQTAACVRYDDQQQFQPWYIKITQDSDNWQTPTQKIHIFSLKHKQLTKAVNRLRKELSSTSKYYTIISCMKSVPSSEKYDRYQKFKLGRFAKPFSLAILTHIFNKIYAYAFATNILKFSTDTVFRAKLIILV